MKALSSILLVLATFLCAAGRAATKPNIVFILCDDLGYGDVKCLNPDGKIATPHMDRLAREGMVFTDAHSSSAVCSPTRYGVITGRYNWRSRLQSGVLGGLSPRLIEEGRLTVPAFLKQHGYRTGAIGKWHLGMDWVKQEGKAVAELNIESADQVHNVAFDKPISNGPTSVGFDYYYGISASLDMVPYTYIENDRVTAVPTHDDEFAMMVGREGGKTRKGPTADGFDAMNVLPDLTRKAVEWIGGQAAAAKKNTPFFLYLPLNAPHTPILPTPEWQGKSGLNPYADFVMQTDDTIGRVVKAVDDAGLTENTLIIVTSDNGCSPSARFDELKAKGHNPSAVYRGNKADIFDGGHRVPYIVRWPAVVKSGGRCDQTICLVDLMATCADILGVRLPDSAGEDSVSLLPAFQGQVDKPLREAVVHHSINGSFSIRQGPWKLELCPDSGGWSEPRPGGAAKGKGKGKAKAAKARPDANSPDAAELAAIGDLAPIQLYDLSQDIGERHNVQAQHPEIVSRLVKLLDKYVREGRSTPGSPQKNTVDPDIFKYAPFAAAFLTAQP